MTSLPLKERLVIVGTGDYYRRIVGPSLAKLRAEGHITILSTVSRNPAGKIAGIPHRIRGENVPLSDLLSDLKKQNPIVLLGHSNDLHTPDADDLVRSGFRVMIEKPYCINTLQMNSMRELLRKYPRKIVLLEYYLMMKTVPLLALAGKIRTDSFYATKKGILHYYPPSKENALFGALQNIIGTPRQIYIDLLEGEGATGVLEHRGSALTDTQKGGGMIQDLGIHALVALFALQDYIGKIDLSFQDGIVRAARCTEYVRAMKKLFSLQEKRIAESYAELEFKTSRGVPVFATVGKYLPEKRNQRRIIITGSEGHLYLDLSSCTLYVAHEENPEVAMLVCPKKSDNKYYPVIRAALETLSRKSPFNFNANQVALDTQQFILNIAAKNRAQTRHTRPNTYRQGARPHAIFNNHAL